MKSSFSYWSKHRRVHNNVADNFGAVLSSTDSGLVEVVGTDTVTVEHHQSVDRANDVVPNEPVYRELQETDRISDNLQAETIERELDSEAILESNTIDWSTSESNVEFGDSDTNDLAEKLSQLKSQQYYS